MNIEYLEKMKQSVEISGSVPLDWQEMIDINLLIQAEIDRQSITDEDVQKAIKHIGKLPTHCTSWIYLSYPKKPVCNMYVMPKTVKETALQALKQMGGKEPCEWCDLDNKRETNTGSGFYMGFKKDPFDNDKVKFFIGETIFKIMVVRFNYCPNCGRGL